MKIELTETEIAQALVDWLMQGSVLKNGGPYDVRFETHDGKTVAFVQPAAPEQLVEINESIEEQD